MKQFYMIPAVMAVALMAAVIGPAGAPADTFLKSKEGWAGDDAYRFINWGLAGTQAAGKSEDVRRSRACGAALLNAQFKALEKLADAGIESVRGTVTVTANKGKIMTEVNGFVRGGKVVEQVFISHDDKCWVVYEIREPGLKGKVQAAVRKHAGK